MDAFLGNDYYDYFTTDYTYYSYYNASEDVPIECS